MLSLHSIPEDILTASDIPSSVAERSRDEMLNFYEQVEQNLFPHLWKHQRIWVDEHFEPLVNGSLKINTSTALIHGDLGCYHVLFDFNKQVINGIIDFGTSGMGSPAIAARSFIE